MMGTATITGIQGRSRQISGESEGTIHISNVSEEYTEDIHDMYRLGDIIRAKVIQVKPSVQLTTAERDLGVVKARCSVCRGPLEVRGRELYCPRDERTERRKLAADYADLKLTVPATGRRFNSSGRSSAPCSPPSSRKGTRPGIRFPRRTNSTSITDP